MDDHSLTSISDFNGQIGHGAEVHQDRHRVFTHQHVRTLHIPVTDGTLLVTVQILQPITDTQEYFEEPVVRIFCAMYLMRFESVF